MWIPLATLPLFLPFFFPFSAALSWPQVPRAASTKSTLLSSAGVTFWKCYFTFCFVFLPFTVRIILSFSQGSCQRRLLFTISMICGCAPSFEECQCKVFTILEVFRKLGVPMADDQREGPSQRLTFLGIEIDSFHSSICLPATVNLQSFFPLGYTRKSVPNLLFLLGLHR